MQLRFALLAVIPAVAGACAASDPPAAVPRTVFVGPGPASVPMGGASSDAAILMTDPAEGVTFAVIGREPDHVLRALVAAYQGLGVEVTLLDPAGARVGNPHLVATRTLAGESVSRFLSCGETMTNQRANSDRIHLSLISTVTPVSGGSSRVETRLEAVAVDRHSGTAGSTIPCRTTGVLERRLHARMAGTG